MKDQWEREIAEPVRSVARHDPMLFIEFLLARMKGNPDLYPVLGATAGDMGRVLDQRTAQLEAFQKQWNARNVLAASRRGKPKGGRG